MRPVSRSRLLTHLDPHGAALLGIVDHHPGRARGVAHAQAVAGLAFDRLAVDPGEGFAVAALHDSGDDHVARARRRWSLGDLGGQLFGANFLLRASSRAARCAGV